MKSENGFTLVESIVVVAVISVLFAISAPSWLKFKRLRTIDATEQRIIQVISKAQNQAISKRINVNVRFKTIDGIPYYSIHRNNKREKWEFLLAGLGIKKGQIDVFGQLDNLTITFNHNGAVSSQVPYTMQVVSPRRDADFRYKRCVVVWTLLGVKRIGSSPSECPVRPGATKFGGRVMWGKAPLESVTTGKLSQGAIKEAT